MSYETVVAGLTAKTQTLLDSVEARMLGMEPPAYAGARATPAYLPALASIDECRVLTGPYTGGYLVAPNGYLNVYFAGLALLGVVAERPAETKAFLNLVLNTLCVVNDGARGQYVIYDIAGIQGTPAQKDPDSNDSYAAVTNTLAYEYAHTSGDWAWYSANIARLKDIAYYNLIVPQKPTDTPGGGMVRTFQTTAWGPYHEICLTEDNCEVYQGLDSLSKGCTAIGATADAAYYANARNGVGLGMNSAVYGVWDEANLRWFTSDQRGAWTDSFYADAVTQVFPELYGVSSGTPATDRQRYDFGWASLNASKPQWESTKYDDFPWMLLALAAAMRGAFDMAEAKMAFVRRTHTRAQFTCNEAGWQRRAEKLIGQRANTVKTVNSASTDLASAIALVNQMRATLIANGLAV
jgi:hypothetical protein